MNRELLLLLLLHPACWLHRLNDCSFRSIVFAKRCVWCVRRVCWSCVEVVRMQACGEGGSCRCWR